MPSHPQHTVQEPCGAFRESFLRFVERQDLHDAVRSFGDLLETLLLEAPRFLVSPTTQGEEPVTGTTTQHEVKAKKESAARRVADKTMRADRRKPRRADARALELLAFRLRLFAEEVDHIARRFRGGLPASESRRGERPRTRSREIPSMEEILEEIERQGFDD